MKKFEKIIGALVILSLIMKFALIPGGSFLTTISLLVLGCIYYPLGFVLFNDIRLGQILKKDSYKGIIALRFIGSIIAGMGLSAICVGIIFKLEQWLGANAYLITGLVSILIISIVALIRFLKNKSRFYMPIFIRISIIGGLGLILLFLSDLTIIKIQYHNHPDYIKAYENYIKDPDNEQLKETLDIEYRRAMMSDEGFEMYMKDQNNNIERK